MQDRYAGDIGDYVKLALLRALAPGRRLGVAWWLYPNGGPTGDGKHVGYLQAPATWRHLDAPLFDALDNVVTSGKRSVASLEQGQVLPGTTYSSEVIPTGTTPADRRSGRSAWFGRCQAALEGCDLVFLDPDNGLEPTSFSAGSKKAGKAVSTSELLALRRPGRTMLVYHHQTRRKGGHVAELGYWADRLRQDGFGRVDVIRATAFSVRAFFLLDADDELRTRAAGFARAWQGCVSWHDSPTLLGG